MRYPLFLHSLATVLALAAPAAAGLPSGGLLAGAPTLCAAGVRFDGQCRSDAWISANLAGGAAIAGAGRCGDATCDLHFTTVEAQAMADGAATHAITTTWVTDAACTRGAGCVGGYAMSLQTVTEITVDADARRVSGQTEMYAGQWGSLAPVVRRTFLGHMDFSSSRGYQRLDVYDAAGVRFDGFLMMASSDATFTESWCDSFVEGLVEAVADGAGAATAYGVGYVLNQGVASLTAAVFLSEVGAPATLAVWVAGTAIATSIAGTAGLAVRSTVKALAETYDGEQLCVDLLADLGVDDPDLPDDPTDEPRDDELAEIGCWICAEWRQDAGYSYEDEKGELVVVAGSGEYICERFELSFTGTDSDGDGWCD